MEAGESGVLLFEPFWDLFPSASARSWLASGNCPTALLVQSLWETHLLPSSVRDMTQACLLELQ